MQFSLVRSGLVTQSSLQGWTDRQQAEIHRRVLKGMQTYRHTIVGAARAQAAGVFKGKGNAARSITSKVHQKKPNRLPALQIYSRIPWLGVHERGKTITGKMLIQFGGTRQKKIKDFRRLIDELRSSGRGFFAKGKDGKVYLWAKLPAKGGGGIARYVTAERGRRRLTNPKARVKREEAVPVAILVTRIRLRKRLQMGATVKRLLPGLAAAVQG